jgi:preprotein translocase subunit SecF
MAAGRMAQWGNDLYAGRRSYDIVGQRKRWFIVSAVIFALTATVLLVRPLNGGIEFTGGSQFTVQGVEDTSQQPAVDAVTAMGDAEVPRVSQVGPNSIRVQTSLLDEAETTELAGSLAAAYGVSQDQVSSTFIGPIWGADVTAKAVRALVIFLGLVALLHDLVITAGLYALVGWEVTPATVIGFLTILGYSLYDTVVVFDKVRENTKVTLNQHRYTYSELANLAINQTLVRSINTSVVAVLPVAAILFIGAFLLGAGTLRDIALALFVGILVGTFSSIFIATPVLTWLKDRDPKIVRHNAEVRDQRVAAAERAGVEEPLRVGALFPGRHQGTGAQPRRKRSGRPSGRPS